MLYNYLEVRHHYLRVRQTYLLLSVVIFITTGKTSFQENDCFLRNLPSQNFAGILSRPECSLGHVECTLENSGEKFLIRFRKLIAQSPKKNVSFFQVFSPKCSSGHAKCSCYNPAQKFLSRSIFLGVFEYFFHVFSPIENLKMELIMSTWTQDICHNISRLFPGVCYILPQFHIGLTEKLCFITY